MIKAIAFDYSGVLKIDPENSLGKLIEYLGTTKEEWDKEWFKVNHLANTGQKTHEEIFLFTCSKFKDTEESQGHALSCLRAGKGNHKVNDGLVEIIKTLKSKDYKIGLLSNYGLELRDKLKDDGIYDLFDAIVISSEVGCQKPDPEIFEILFTKLGVKPEEVVFTDDAPKSLEKADSIGYFPVLYKDNESFRLELEKILEISL